ncbi:MAG: sugar kinase [Chitinophagaceae bacterium]|nr:MAG: sugar kinase [Chitinophagaceae bacterium]
MSRVLCFGELLMRLSPQLGGEWIRQNTMPVFIGGAELNTATALANWDVPASYCTALPDHYLTKEIVESVETKGIDISRIHYSGNRIGTYYLPQGADLKNAGVIYDRAYSSFWELKRGQLDWDAILDDVSWFNFSAISPALNEAVAAVCKEGAAAASKKGIIVSVDLNYRAKLWQYGKQPHEIMPELIEYCDVIMGNIWAEEKMLGISVPQDIADEKEAYLVQSQKTSEEILKRFPKCKQVANTFRFDKAEGLHYYATLYTGGQLYLSAQHQTKTVIDRVGSGDTFMAGLIYGNFHKNAPQEIIDFAAAAAFNKLFIKGDATTSTVEDIKKDSLNYA